MSPLPIWLQRWNFIERAKHERSLWEAFERGDNIEQRVAELAQQLASNPAAGSDAGERGADPEKRFQLEVWQATLPRIRRIEAMMRERSGQG